MQNRLASTAALTLSLIATAASAEGVRTEKNMSLDLATRLRNTTMQAAARHRNTLPGQLAEMTP